MLLGKYVVTGVLFDQRMELIPDLSFTTFFGANSYCTADTWFSFMIGTGNYMQVFSDLERSVCRMVHKQVTGFVSQNIICDIQYRLEICYAGGIPLTNRSICRTKYLSSKTDKSRYMIYQLIIC